MFILPLLLSLFFQIKPGPTTAALPADDQVVLAFDGKAPSLARTPNPSYANSIIDLLVDFSQIQAAHDLLAKNGITFDKMAPTKREDINSVTNGSIAVVIGPVTLGDHHPLTAIFVQLEQLNDKDINALLSKYKILIVPDPK